MCGDMLRIYILSNVFSWECSLEFTTILFKDKVLSVDSKQNYTFAWLIHLFLQKH